MVWDGSSGIITGAMKPGGLPIHFGVDAVSAKHRKMWCDIGNYHKNSAIANATVSGSAVFVDSNGQLGITAPSRRFKDEIRDIGCASGGLLRLRQIMH